MKSETGQSGFAFGLGLVLALLLGCTAYEENADPGSPLYLSTVEQSVREQNERDASGMEDGRGGPDIGRGTSSKDRAMLTYIRNDLVQMETAEVSSVYTYWSEDAAAFKRIPEFGAAALVARPDSFFVYLDNDDRNFKQVPYSKRFSHLSETKPEWAVTVTITQNNFYIYWCENHKKPHRRVWTLQDTPEPMRLIETGSHQ